ncbi:MAG: Co2+/Mg2+ efflux protein ApaG [Rhodothermales bacterium]|nr:Co2+/Mg2+ efflux protein ApaG [Rhodothermales bacterium]
MTPYTATTAEVTVAVRPVYLDEPSDALKRRFVFAYFVRVENDGAAPVQLLRRRWLIRDDSGKTVEVEGEGVVGEQPIIEPGGAHEYSSFCVLETMAGSMEGVYVMERARGQRFRAQIPLFHLRAGAN